MVAIYWLNALKPLWRTRTGNIFLDLRNTALLPKHLHTIDLREKCHIWEDIEIHVGKVNDTDWTSTPIALHDVSGNIITVLCEIGNIVEKM